MTQSTVTVLQTAFNYITDSRDGYSNAANIVAIPTFKDVFNERAGERTAMMIKLEKAIRDAGGTPGVGGSALGAMHRSLMSIAAIVQDDEKAALKSIDDGEERLRQKFDVILRDGDLTPKDKAMIAQIKSELEADRRMIERMKATVE